MATILETLKTWRRSFRKKRKNIVTLRLPSDKALTEMATGAAELAMEKGLSGDKAREFAMKELVRNIESVIKGNPDTQLGRLIEILDDVLGIFVEMGYQIALARLEAQKAA